MALLRSSNENGGARVRNAGEYRPRSARSTHGGYETSVLLTNCRRNRKIPFRESGAFGATSPFGYRASYAEASSTEVQWGQRVAAGGICEQQ